MTDSRLFASSTSGARQINYAILLDELVEADIAQLDSFLDAAGTQQKFTVVDPAELVYETGVVAFTQLNALSAFVEVARRKSFAAAGRDLGVSTSPTHSVCKFLHAGIRGQFAMFELIVFRRALRAHRRQSAVPLGSGMGRSAAAHDLLQ